MSVRSIPLCIHKNICYSPKERIEKLKKVWYKDNIDPNFDLDYQPGPH